MHDQITTQTALSCAVDNYRRSWFTKPPKTNRAKFADAYLHAAVRRMRTLAPNDPLIDAASHCPQDDGRLLLGPEAAAVLDGLLTGTLDAEEFIEELTLAIEADLLRSSGGIAGCSR